MVGGLQPGESNIYCICTGHSDSDEGDQQLQIKRMDRCCSVAPDGFGYKDPCLNIHEQTLQVLGGAVSWSGQNWCEKISWTER